MSGRTVRVAIEDHTMRVSETVPICDALGLDPDTPFDPARQRCIVVDVCDACHGEATNTLGTGPCARCEGRGWVVP